MSAGAALDVEDSALLRIGRRHDHPGLVAVRHRVGRNAAKVFFCHEIIQRVRIAGMVAVVLVEGIPHLVQVLAQHGFLCLVDPTKIARRRQR